MKVDNEAKASKLKGLYEYVNLLNTPKEPSIHVNYRLLVELCKIFRDDRTNRVIKKLIDYGTIKSSDSSIEKLVELAGNFADDFSKQEKVEITVDDTTKVALKELVELLSDEKEPEDLQNSIYQISKKNGVSPKDFFRILYQIILASNRGPKIGPFITDIGRKKVAQTLLQHV